MINSQPTFTDSDSCLLRGQQTVIHSLYADNFHTVFCEAAWRFLRAPVLLKMIKLWNLKALTVSHLKSMSYIVYVKCIESYLCGFQHNSVEDWRILQSKALGRSQGHLYIDRRAEVTWLSEPNVSKQEISVTLYLVKLCNSYHETAVLCIS